MITPNYIVKKRNKHDEDIRKILRENNCYAKDSFGRVTTQIVRWNGTKICADMRKAGHSSLDFNKCKCHLT